MSDSSIRLGCLEEATITIERAKFDIAKSTDSSGVLRKHLRWNLENVLVK